MTKKEQEPQNNKEERAEQPKGLNYNSNITEEDKEVLNNQSEERKGEYFKDRETPIDYEGEDLDIPKFDDEQFNPTTNKPDESELEERPKESADDLDLEGPGAETVYKGDAAKRYRDPSEKTRRNK